MKNTKTIARHLPLAVVTFVPSWNAVGATSAATYQRSTHQVASHAPSPPV